MYTKERLLFVSGEGVGNITQTIPVVRTLSQEYDVDYWHAFGSFPLPAGFFPYIKNWYSGHSISNINIKDYIGFATTYWTRNSVKILINSGMIQLTDIYKVDTSDSEVNTYMNIARDLAFSEDQLLWHGECGYNKSDEYFDIVMHNGYNFTSNPIWQYKSYPYYEQVASKLDLKVCSVGNKREYINGTIDKTGLSLLDTLGLIKNSKLFVGNDSGLYHCANSLGVCNLVIFTFTSTTKNYDKRFHKYSKIIRKDLDCSPCQGTIRFNACEDRKCRDITSEGVLNAINNELKRN